MPTSPDTLLLDWSIVPAAHHNVRVLCDLSGLSYDEKEIIAACVYQESGYDINAVHENRDGQGRVLSTDYGITQINSYWNIGAGKEFPTVEYVLTHPQHCVQFMIDMLKVGKLSLWCSYSTGAYKQHLGKV